MKKVYRIALFVFLVLALLVGGGLIWFQNLELSPVAGMTVEDSEARIDPAALQDLLASARQSDTAALVVMKDGQLVGAWQRGGWLRKLETMSATKSIVNLAVGRLITLRKIESVDVPVAQFFEEWSDGPKSQVTLRHLLSHTSGLQAKRTALDIYEQRDFVRYALEAELESEPGAKYFYNNKACNLLAGIVGKAAGKPLDEFLREDLFAELGIVDFKWKKDGAGNPHGMSGLVLLPTDLATIGQFVLDRGVYEGKQLIDDSWFDLCLQSGMDSEWGCGLLWWISRERTAYIVDDDKIAELREAGVPPEFVERYEACRGRYETQDDMVDVWKQNLGPDAVSQINATLGPLNLLACRMEWGALQHWNANGWLGQWLVIYPEEKIVGVRMSEYPLFGNPEANPNIEFSAFPEKLKALFPE